MKSKKKEGPRGQAKIDHEQIDIKKYPKLAEIPTILRTGCSHKCSANAK